jgi:hypothetical protein
LFEHKFDPFSFYHTDLYAYIGLHADGYSMSRYFRLYPRPLGYVILELCGRLGIHWLLAPMFIFAMANAALVAAFVERLAGKKIPVLSFVLFCAGVFANPWYQIHVKADPLAIFSLAFILIGFHVWQCYVEQPRPWHIPTIVVLIALGSFIKESYFCVIGLFFLIQLITRKDKKKEAAFVLAICSAIMAYSLHRASQLWFLFHEKAQPTDAYYTDMHPAAVVHGFITLGRHLTAPALAVGIALILFIAWRKDRRLFWIGAASVALSVAALLPNSTLPNHLELQYAVLGSELFTAPLLLTWLVSNNQRTRMLVAGVVTVTTAIGMFEYSRTSRSEMAWIQAQESYAERIVGALEGIRNETPANNTFLVTGIDKPYNPFYVDNFIESLMGSGRFFKVIVPDSIPSSTRRVTELVHASDPESAQAGSNLLVFEPDGSLKYGHGLPPTAVPTAPDSTHSSELRLWATLPPAGADQSGRVRTIHWSIPGVSKVEIHVGSPSGKLFAAGGQRGEATTGSWAQPGLRFYLQDATQGDSTLPSRTLATLILE